jgi:probable O-glycosylation ligase (exosortase A-associated)
MPLRDITLAIFVFGMLPLVLRYPHWGILLWTWIGLMTPHRLTWSFAYNFQWANFVGLTTIFALLMSREPKRLPWQPPVVALLGFLFWMTVTTVVSLYPDKAWERWEEVMKIQFFILLTLAVMQQQDRIKALVWVSTLSLAFFGIKGGIFTISTGGSQMVLGPPGGFISGNTEISLALTMVIPLMRWLQLQSKERWLRWGLGAGMGITAIAILGSYSRGGLLAIAAMGAFLWLKSRHKLWMTLVLVPLVPLALDFMPDKWFERMNTIQTYQQDPSAMGRINAWGYAINVASTYPLTGGGFRSFTPATFAVWAPDPGNFHAAHSIWFQVLGEHGFAGLAIFLLFWFLTWRTGSGIIKACRGRPELRWASDLAAMIQVSLIGFWVGGTFLSLSYWDYPYILMTLLVLTKAVLSRQIQPRAPPLATVTSGPATVLSPARDVRQAGTAS